MNTTPNSLDDRARWFRDQPFVMYAMPTDEQFRIPRRYGRITAMIAMLREQYPTVKTWYLIVPPDMEDWAMRWARAYVFNVDAPDAAYLREGQHGRIAVKVDTSLPPGEWFIGSQPDRAPYSDAPGIGGKTSGDAAAPSLGGLRHPQRIEKLIARQASRNISTMTYYQRVAREDNPTVYAEIHYAARLFHVRPYDVTAGMVATLRANMNHLDPPYRANEPRPHEIRVEGTFDVSELQQALDYTGLHISRSSPDRVPHMIPDPERRGRYIVDGYHEIGTSEIRVNGVSVETVSDVEALRQAIDPDQTVYPPDMWDRVRQNIARISTDIEAQAFGRFLPPNPSPAQLTISDLRGAVEEMRAELNMPNIGIGVDSAAGPDQTWLYLTDTRHPGGTHFVGHVEADGSTVTIHDEFRAELIETANADVIELRGYGLNDEEIDAYMRSVRAAMAAGVANFAESFQHILLQFRASGFYEAMEQIAEAVEMLRQDDSDGEPRERPEIADPIQRRHSNRLERNRGRAYEARRRHDIPAPRNLPRRF
jgi:hypothetical protein